jgi:serine O-acetyltransferase
MSQITEKTRNCLDIQHLPFWKLVRADLQRINGGSRTTGWVHAWFADRTFRPVFTLRLCQSMAKRRGSMGRLALTLAKILHRWAQHHACMDLPWNVSVGPGFRIVHGWGLVVTPGAAIGSNVTVFHGATIGRKDDILPGGQRHTTFPVVEDQVWIGPHAVVVGQVRLKMGARVAAGTVVTGDVSPCTIVGGNPMRVLREGALPDILNPASLNELGMSDYSG